jgi:hypothetical protein
MQHTLLSLATAPRRYCCLRPFDLLTACDRRSLPRTRSLQRPSERASLEGIATMFACYIFGFLIYLTQFPERRWPGRFDIWVRLRAVRYRRLH